MRRKKIKLDTTAAAVIGVMPQLAQLTAGAPQELLGVGMISEGLESMRSFSQDAGCLPSDEWMIEEKQ